MKRKFYKTVIQIEILTEDLPYESGDLYDMASDTDTGECVGITRILRWDELTGRQMAAALYTAGSEPGFFRLDGQGQEIED